MSDEGKVYVGSLCFDTNEETLAEAFGKYGAIEKVEVIKDRESGESRGFGFVTYVNEEDAKAAVIGMNGKSLDGRSLRVDAAGNKGNRRGFQPRGRGSRGGGGGYNGDGGFGGRSYSGRNYSDGDRGYGGGGGGGDRGYGGGRYRGNSYRGAFRDDRERGGNYRESYDSYASNE